MIDPLMRRVVVEGHAGLTDPLMRRVARIIDRGEWHKLKQPRLRRRLVAALAQPNEAWASVIRDALDVDGEFAAIARQRAGLG